MSSDKKFDLEWFKNQVDEYARLRDSHYKAFANLLREVLEEAARKLAPHALIQARAKTVPSFAEKILRKRHKYSDPVRQLTDLCGARVIVHTKAEVESICSFIRGYFAIDKDNSIDSANLLRASEFGYRSVHYIIQFAQGIFEYARLRKEVSEAISKLKAEIQVRTIAQHCWADIGHDRLYKSAFKVPDQFIRDSARAAAHLEDVDETFERVVVGLGTYQIGAGPYLKKEKVEEEIKILETVLESAGSPGAQASEENPVWDDHQLELAQRIARLLMSLEDWPKTVAFLQRFRQAPPGPLHYYLGLALTKLHKDDPRGAEHGQARQLLARVLDADPANLEALIALGNAWIGLDEDKGRDYFEQAFKLDPSHPLALAEYIRFKISKDKSLSFIPLIRHSLEAAIRKCRELARVGVNLPDGYYHIGAFNLLLGKPYESLTAFAKAIQFSASQGRIAEALKSLERFQPVVEQQLPEVEWVRRLLLLGIAVTPEKKTAQESPPKALAEPPAELARLAATGKAPIKEPVVILAGGCDYTVQQRMEAYRQLLLQAFGTFTGTIFGGGTNAGISGLAGDVAEQSGGRIQAIGYLPQVTPAGAVEDPRYQDIRRTSGSNVFSALEPLQNWIDLLAAGIPPARVKLLGINGGEIAAFEYRLALIMGAEVGILRDSGREAEKLAADPEWGKTLNLALMPTDLMTLRHFLERPAPPSVLKNLREFLGKRAHEEYMKAKKSEAARKGPAMVDWRDLPESFKESNRQQADHIESKLKELGVEIYTLNQGEKASFAFTPEEVEHLAEREHARWNIERLLAGWTRGDERSDEKKIHPQLVAWDDLSEDVKQYDRDAVLAIPRLLEENGMGLRRNSEPES